MSAFFNQPPKKAHEPIRDGDAAWEEMVPPEVAELIKRRGFFGYRRIAIA